VIQSATKRGAAAVALALLITAGTGARAEDVSKKFRVGFMLGFMDPSSKLQSDAANELRLFDHELEFQVLYQYPRYDSSVFGALELTSEPLTNFSLQYAATKMLMIEMNLGYQQSDLCCVEVQAQFNGVPIDEQIGFNFQTFRINAGTVERIPLQIGALVRFRPRSTFNPYVGGGLGYSFVGFSPSDEFNDLSINMDNSNGGLAGVSPATFGAASFTNPSPGAIENLSGAQVDIGDSFEWYLAAGAEITVAHKWAVIIDLRQTFSSRSFRVGFNGSDYLGIPVPQLVDFTDSAAALQGYGAMRITEGGLIDGGQLMPTLFAPPGTDCEITPDQCQFVNEPDGELDQGFYYVQGGEIDYDAFIGQIGFRYTF
jgi:opacity protein-like surface antigen